MWTSTHLKGDAVPFQSFQFHVVLQKLKIFLGGKCFYCWAWTVPCYVFQGSLHIWKEGDRGWFPIGSSGHHGWIEGLTYPSLAPSILPESGLE